MDDLIERRVTTKRAAEIAGMGYEGLRSCLKRGLLKHTGMLLPFVERGQPAPELDAKRWTWKEFHVADVGLYRLAKILMDAGLSFEDARDIVNREDLWQFFWGDDFIEGPVAVRYLVFSMTDAPTWNLYTKDQLAAEVADGALDVDAGPILIDITAVREAVAAAMLQSASAREGMPA